MTRSERIEKAARMVVGSRFGKPAWGIVNVDEALLDALAAALAPDPLSCPRCNHDPAVHKNGRCRYCDGPCPGQETP